MKDLVTFIQENIHGALNVSESLRVNKDTKLATKINLENYPNVNGKRDIPKEDVRRFKQDDEYTKQCFVALQNEFRNQYSLRQLSSGSIYFYKKGSRCTMKDLICGVNSNAYIDFGPNAGLVNKLGDEIFNIIDNVN